MLIDLDKSEATSLLVALKERPINLTMGQVLQGITVAESVSNLVKKLESIINENNMADEEVKVEVAPEDEAPVAEEAAEAPAEEAAA